ERVGNALDLLLGGLVQPDPDEPVAAFADRVDGLVVRPRSLLTPATDVHTAVDDRRRQRLTGGGGRRQGGTGRGGTAVVPAAASQPAEGRNRRHGISRLMSLDLTMCRGDMLPHGTTERSWTA